MGWSTKASGLSSIALGDGNSATATQSTALGGYNLASGLVSTALGYNTTASGYISTAMGYGTKAESYGSTAIGKYNIGGGNATTWVATDPLFEIGIGTSVGDKNNAVTVLKNGKVGIGTTTPGQALDVIGSVKAKTALIVGINSASTGAVRIANNSGIVGRNVANSNDLWLLVPGSDDNVYLGYLNSIVFRAGATERMRITNSGNVGIGNSNPLEKLVVKMGGTTWGSPHFALEASGSTNKWDFTVGGSDRFYIGYNESSKFVIDTDGNVGIGTIGPAGKLDVNGSIYQRGGSLHADYVFDDDYDLESIQDHSDFMWTEKHLKAIPKARVDENGNEIVEVGAHRKGIVEELEKAHIYITQLEERISKLESILTE